jgi:hypothetical protein
MAAIDFTKVVPIAQMTGDDAEDTRLLISMATEAREFLLSFKWCEDIIKGYFGIGIGGVVAVFLFHIRPSRQEVDDLVWVVVGDLPPLYLATDDAPNPACALDGYVGAMDEWADAAIAGGDVSRLVPVDAEASSENAERLKKRLAFIERELPADYQADLA